MKKITLLDNHPADSRVEISRTGKCQTLSSRMGTGGGNVPMIIEERSDSTMDVVRRLVPAECERLQGFPTNWTLIGTPEVVKVKDFKTNYIFEVDENGEKQIKENGKELVGEHEEVKFYYTDLDGKKKECNDSNRYKALGNSIALPQWFWIAQKMKKYLQPGATLGSLFDGIGGFPLTWESTYGEHTARWASEIEPFPICVTTQHFGDESRGIEGDLYNGKGIFYYLGVDEECD